MKIKELKNYGVEMNEMFQKIPKYHPEVVKKSKSTAINIIRKRIGTVPMLYTFYMIGKEKKKIDKIPFPLREPMSEETANMLQQSFAGKAAMFRALARVTDKKRAMEILKEITDATAYESAMTQLPMPEDFKACGDSFDAFREYILEMFRVSKQAGIHNFQIIENTDDCLEFDITYCAIFEYMRSIAPKEACEANCYGDQILFPHLCPKVGACFKRKGNMACGYSCCNTRYERMI
jgi:L-2-amino-thiazoline-4-carboxylic acid hydrolase